MWSKYKELLILIIIIALGAFFRLYHLSSNPPGLTWDEAALGYNAYSIMLTGRDEYGHLLPLNLESFGDWKPAFYSYVAIPFVAVLGLNELSVRLVSALAGIGFIIAVYFLANELFGKKWLSLSIVFCASVSPLSIMFSRAAFESNLALLLNTLGILFFLKSFLNKKYIFFSMIFFVMSCMTYQASRLLVPLIVLGLLFFNFRKIYKDKIFISAMAAFFAVYFLLTVSVFAFGQSDRLATANFFAYRRSEDQISEISREDGLNKDTFSFNAIHGEWFAYLRGLFERYLIYFSPKMLAIEGDYSPRHSVPDLGPLYYYSIFLFPLGGFYLLLNKKKSATLIFFLLAVAPVPAVLSRDLISFVRALNLVLPWVFLEGAGLYLLLNYLILGNNKFKQFIIPVVFLVVFYNVSIFADRYFVHFPVEHASGWLFGYKQVFGKLKEIDLNKQNKVVVTDYYGQPYIYYLFFNRYDPQKFQKQAKLDQPTVDVGTVRNIDNIEFRKIYWPGDRGDKNSLFVGTQEELPDQDTKPFVEFKNLSDIFYPDGKMAFRIIQIK